MASPRIFALTKTFRGHEFATASLESLYNHVVGMLYVHSDIGWGGRTGNTVRPAIDAWCKQKQAQATKIHQIGPVEPSQNGQYEAGRQWLLARDDWDWLALVDTDEVFDADMLDHVVSVLDASDQAHAIRTAIVDYIKSPFYRVAPPSPQRPPVFVPRSLVEGAPIGVRGVGYPFVERPDIRYHHFSTVRESLTEVISKHVDSCTADGDQMRTPRDFVENVWNKLPLARDCHPVACAAGNWPGVEVVGMRDLPEAVRGLPLVRAWDAWPRVPRAIEMMGLLPRATPSGTSSAGRGGRPLPPDFGPGHPDWNMPSKRNRWYAERAAAAANQGNK